MMVSGKVCIIHIQNFFGMVRKNSKHKYLLLELVKRRSKFQETNMSCERDFNFDQ